MNAAAATGREGERFFMIILGDPVLNPWGSAQKETLANYIWGVALVKRLPATTPAPRRDRISRTFRALEIGLPNGHLQLKNRHAWFVRRCRHNPTVLHCMLHKCSACSCKWGRGGAKPSAGSLGTMAFPPKRAGGRSQHTAIFQDQMQSIFPITMCQAFLL